MIVPESHLLSLLPRRDRMRLIAISESVDLELGAVRCKPGEPTRHVYFPNDCFLSLVATVNGEPGLEVGMVGSEGMLGAQLVLGVSVIPLHAVVQGTGTARHIEAALFRREFGASKGLQRVLNRYI